MVDGLVDTNIFIHAQTRDLYAEECLLFLEAVMAGRVRAQIEPMILHELSYALRHYRKEMTRLQIAAYLLMVLSWAGVRGEKDVLADTVRRWRDTPDLAFVDAYLAAVASERKCPVFTKNIAELRKQGVAVPGRLPA